MYPLWIFDRLGAGPVYDPALQFVPYQWIYMRRPDGQLLRAGDGQSRPPKLRSLLNASYYKDPYVLADYLRDPRHRPAAALRPPLAGSGPQAAPGFANCLFRATWACPTAG